MNLENEYTGPMLRMKVRHYLWRKSLESQSKSPILITREIIELLGKASLPNPSEQANNLIGMLAQRRDAFWDLLGEHHGVLIGAFSVPEFEAVCNHALDKGYVSGNLTNIAVPQGPDFNSKRVVRGLKNAHLTVNGWIYYEELQKGRIDSNKAFMAMDYGNTELAEVVKDHFKLAVEQAGFELRRLDENLKPGLIDVRMLAEIQTSAFVIADLSNGNAGAYFEAGYAMALGKVVIFTCHERQFKERHFDASHYTTVKWSKDTAQEAAATIKGMIRAALPGHAKMQDDETDSREE